MSSRFLNVMLTFVITLHICLEITQYHVRFHLTRGNVLVKYVTRKGLCKDFVTWKLLQ